MKTMHIETGFWFEEEKTDSARIFGRGLNSTLFRYGLLKKTELRLDYNLWNSKTQPIKKSETGFYPLRLGLKYHVTYHKGIRPSVTFIGMQEVPYTATKNFRSQNLNTDFQLSFAHELNHRLALCYNLGAVMNFSDEKPFYYYALAAELTLGKKTGVYLQFRRSLQEITDGGNNLFPHYLTYVESGFMYYPNHNMQLDISGRLKSFEGLEKKSISIRQHSYFFYQRVSVGVLIFSDKTTPRSNRSVLLLPT